jgi:phasin family protein
MFPIQDQISVATKAGLEAQFALFNSLTNKTLESVEKLINLNLAAVKASMEESGVTTRQILAAKDPQEFLSLVTAQTKPNFEKAIAYGSHLANIASSTQAEFTKAAEQQIAAVSSKVNELVEDAARNAPAGAENLIAVVKSAIGNANAGYEQFAKTSKQAAEAVEANLNSAVAQLSPTAEKAGQKIVVES